MASGLLFRISGYILTGMQRRWYQDGAKTQMAPFLWSKTTDETKSRASQAVVIVIFKNVWGPLSPHGPRVDLSRRRRAKSNVPESLLPAACQHTHHRHSAMRPRARLAGLQIATRNPPRRPVARLFRAVSRSGRQRPAGLPAEPSGSSRFRCWGAGTCSADIHGSTRTTDTAMGMRSTRREVRRGGESRTALPAPLPEPLKAAQVR